MTERFKLRSGIVILGVLFAASATLGVDSVSCARYRAESSSYFRETEAVSSLLSPVDEWNQEAARLTVLPASGLAPVQQTRVMAIVQVSVHDAVNGTTRQYRTYMPTGPAPAGASPEAAAIAAAHLALRNLFPSHGASLDDLFLTSLAEHGLSVGDPGIEYGRSAAAAILNERANDGAASAQYNFRARLAGQPGVWVPLTSAPALLPGWGNVTPWVLTSGSQFRPPAPPALDSEQYARDYNEIKAIGSLNSTIRTAEQTQIATFWLGSPVAIWNPVIGQLVAANNLDISARARTYALVHMAAADSSIAGWETKYRYNFWRPQPAIRRGDEDGNPLTAADPVWTPLFPTPRHPEYISGHTVNSTAMATIMRQLFGDAPGIPLTSTVTGITRQWNSFSEGLDEVIEARIYSGIHFRTADEVGSAQGEQVALYVWNNALGPCPGGRLECQ